MKNIQGIGGFLVMMGLGSTILTQFDYEFQLLMWIDNWGPGIGWGIRTTMTVVGAGLWFLGFKNK